MSDEAQPKPIQQLLESPTQRLQLVDSLHAFLRERVLQLNQDELFALLVSLQSSPHSDNFDLQSFVHAEHLEAIRQRNGEQRVGSLSVPEELADITVHVDSPTASVPPEEVLVVLLLEWLKKTIPSSSTLTAIQSNVGTHNGTAQEIPIEAESVVMEHEERQLPLPEPQLTPESLQELSRLSPRLQEQLLSGGFYVDSEGRQAIAAEQVFSLMYKTDKDTARQKIQQYAPGFQELPKDALPSGAYVPEHSEEPTGFYILRDAVALCLTLQAQDLLPNFPSEIPVQPVVPAPSRTSPPVVKPNTPTGSTSERQHERRQSMRYELDGRGNGFSMEIFEEVTTLLTINDLRFGNHTGWVQKNVSKHVQKVGENNFYISLFDIHTEILGGDLTKLYDDDFRKHLVPGTTLGNGAVKTNFYFPLKIGLEYIHKGYSTDNIGLKCMQNA